MSKILYPVGTEVQIRNWKVDALKADGHTYDRRKRVVSKYVKGSATPYHLEGVKIAFAVKDIKRYQGSATVKNDRAFEDGPMNKASMQNSLTPCDVRSIIREELEAERQLAADAELAASIFNQTIESLDSAKEDTNMSASETIRQKLIYASKPKQERVLQEAEILSNGYLTEQGRRVVIDYIWESDKDLQKAVYEAVKKLTAKDKKSKKDSDDEE